MSAPLFSVVVPTRNRADLLATALSSVVRQTCSDFELIVSDNDSSDNTPAVAIGFGDKRISYVKTAKYLPLSASWEFASRHATGKYLWLLGDDDVMARDALATFQKVISDGSPAIAVCGTVRYHAPSHPIPRLRNVIHGRRYVDEVRKVPSREVLEAYFSLEVSVDTLVPHPSAICISQEIVGDVRRRTGAFFHPPYPEFTAIPLALACTDGARYIGRPLVVVGITAASWGSNVIFTDPVAAWRDVGEPFTRTPLKGRYFTNGVAESLLRTQELEPVRLKPFTLSLEHYFRSYIEQMTFQGRLGRDTRDDEAALQVALEGLPTDLRGRLRSTIQKAAVVRALGRVRLLGAARSLRSLLRRGVKHDVAVIDGRTVSVHDIETCEQRLETICSRLVSR